MIDAATEPKLTGARISGTAEQPLPWSKAIRFFTRFGAYDLATVLLIAALEQIPADVGHRLYPAW
jgi:hypothetical protein